MSTTALHTRQEIGDLVLKDRMASEKALKDLHHDLEKYRHECNIEMRVTSPNLLGVVSFIV